MDTSMLEVDVQPTYVRVVVKDKVTQLLWPDEVLTDGAKVQRSQTTGWLMITCDKANINEIQLRNMQIAYYKDEKAKRDQLKQLEKAEEEGKEAKRKELDRLTQQAIDQSSNFVIREASKGSKTGKENKHYQDNEFEVDFDEDEVPDLE